MDLSSILGLVPQSTLLSFPWYFPGCQQLLAQSDIKLSIHLIVQIVLPESTVAALPICLILDSVYLILLAISTDADCHW